MLSEERFEHSLSTAKYGYRLGKQYGVDPERVYLTGLLHDVARELPASSLLLHARKQGIILRKEENLSISLAWKSGAFIVRKELESKTRAFSMHSFPRSWQAPLDQAGADPVYCG